MIKWIGAILNKQATTRKPISTRAHGVIDYLWAVMVPVLPQLLQSEPGIKRLLTLSGVGTLIYSLFTRYELGAVKLLPMKAHLAIDMVQGMLLLLASLWPSKDRRSKVALFGLALVVLLVTFNTQRVDQQKNRLQRLMQRVQSQGK